MSPRADRPMPSGGNERGGLGSELNKKSGFDSIEQRVHLGLIRTAAVSEGPLAAVFRACGLSMSTYNILRILRGSGGTGRRATEIAPDMVVRVPDVSRLLDRLEGEGLIRRDADPEDRRRVVVQITHAGLDRVSEIEAAVLAAHDSALSCLTIDELRVLDGLLARIRIACDQHAAASE